jgi:hypothetical protein
VWCFGQALSFWSTTMSTLIEVNHNKSEPDDDAASIKVNHNKPLTLEEHAARRVRLSRRGRKPGWGKKHDAGTKPKTFKNFSPTAEKVLTKIKLLGPDFMALSDGEVVERALVEYGRTLVRRLANRSPIGVANLGRALPEPGDE